MSARGARSRRGAPVAAVALVALVALAGLAVLVVPRLAPAFDLGKTLGAIAEHKDAIVKTGTALRKTFTDLSPQEEYYLGRAVAAHVLGTYRPLEDEKRTRYLNTLGRTLALVSDRPETYGGWHFQLLDSDEINAFAAPGGLVMVTRGLYATCATEDQLAAVLAHEIGHVTLKHGLAAIKNERLTEAFTIIGSEALKEKGDEKLTQLTAAFDGSIQDIANKMIVSGYSQTQEYAADAEAAKIAWRAGFDPAGLTEFLAALRDQGKKGASAGFFSTHPKPGDRLSKAAAVIKSGKLAGQTDPVRTERFAQYAMR